MNNTINLISPKKDSYTSAFYKRIQMLRISAMTLLFGVSTAAVILFMLIALSPLPQLQLQERAERQALSQFHPEMAKLQVIHDRTAKIRSVLGNRVPYDAVLSSVQSKMVPNLTLTAYTVTDKTLSLTVSSKSLTSLETFLQNLTAVAGKGKEFSSVTMVNMVQDNEQFVYVMTVKVRLL